MPKQTEQMYFVSHGTLFRPDGSPICEVSGKTGFRDWLRYPEHRSFRYESLAGGNCTVLKERRAGRSGEIFDYWYAHRHVFGKLRRVYLGKSEIITIQVLERAAVMLAQLEMDGLEAEKNAGTL
jgi:hypothetical protein